MAIASARGLFAGITMFFCAGGLRGSFKIRELTAVHFLAGISLALLSSFFITAVKFTTSANAIVLNYSAPIWVAILAPFLLKEKTSGRDWFYVTVIIGGMVLFFFGGLSPVGLLGNVFAIVSGFFYATQAMCLRYLKSCSPASALILGNFLTFFVGLGFWGPPWPDLESVFYLLVLGVFQLGFTYYIYAEVSPYLNSLELLVMTMIEPILNPVWVFWVLGEKPGPYALIGGLIVVSGVLVWSWGNVKSKSAKPPAPET
jgi:drug/metabolite transporter (DMT)-like permease